MEGPVKTLTSIAVTTQPDKATYYVGESFDSKGMKVTATYDDESTAELSESQYIIDVADPLVTVGTIPVTVTAKADTTKTATFNITVKARGVLTSVKLLKAPDKVDYAVGDTFDLTGLQLTLGYDDEGPDVVWGPYEEMSAEEQGKIETTPSFSGAFTEATKEDVIIKYDNICMTAETFRITVSDKKVYVLRSNTTTYYNSDKNGPMTPEIFKANVLCNGAVWSDDLTIASIDNNVRLGASPETSKICFWETSSLVLTVPAGQYVTKVIVNAYATDKTSSVFNETHVLVNEEVGPQVTGTSIDYVFRPFSNQINIHSEDYNPETKNRYWANTITIETMGVENAAMEYAKAIVEVKNTNCDATGETNFPKEKWSLIQGWFEHADDSFKAIMASEPKPGEIPSMEEMPANVEALVWYDWMMTCGKYSAPDYPDFLKRFGSASNRTTPFSNDNGVVILITSLGGVSLIALAYFLLRKKKAVK